MPKSRSSRRSRKGRKQQPIRPVGQETTRAVAQPVAVAEAGEAPSAAPRERTPTTKMTRRDYSYVRRDLQRIAVLATAVLITIVVLSFFLP